MKSIVSKIKNDKELKEKFQFLLYEKKYLENIDQEFLFSVALLLIEEYEKQQEKWLIELSYFIIAKVSIHTKNYRALYDFSINYGYYPIAKKIQELGLLDRLSWNDIVANIELSHFSDEKKTLTLEQFNIFNKISEKKDTIFSFIAPTSYGKSEMIFNHLRENDQYKNIAIIVPTKSLINQVYNDSKKHVKNRKILVHDQNYNKDESEKILAVVTQERALRLIESGCIFDIIYIDEAQELLPYEFNLFKNNRSLLLARFIRIARKKNNFLKEVYLSPVIKNSDNLKLIDKKEITEYKINNDLKLLNIRYYDSNEKILFQYDKYFNEFLEISKNFNYDSIISKYSFEKNLHYLYKPKDIESYADRLSKIIPDIIITNALNDLIIELEDLIHPKYKLISFLKKGIIYLHGKVPNNIRDYLIYFVKENESIKHFIANSVILAGMNLPIDNLFYISGNANMSEMKNLIGRINRLNYIFDRRNNIDKIMVPVTFININEFPQYRKAGLKKKIQNLSNIDKTNDDVRNPLLENVKVPKNNYLKVEKIRKNEEEIIDYFDQVDMISKIKRSQAQQLLRYTEKGLEIILKRISECNMIPNENILDKMRNIFFLNLTDEDYRPLYNIKRLENKHAINYYKVFLKNINTLNYRERINKQVLYWKKNSLKNNYIYIGEQFGEIPRETENYKNSKNVYVDLSKYMDDEDALYNLAIVKLQIDEEFLNYELMALLKLMVDVELITEVQLDELIFGTIREDELQIMKLGLSRTLYLKLKNDDMLGEIKFDSFGNIKCGEELRNYINSQKGIVRFELEQYFL